MVKHKGNEVDFISLHGFIIAIVIHDNESCGGGVTHSTAMGKTRKQAFEAIKKTMDN